MVRQPAETVAGVFTAIERVKSNSPAFCTNFFPAPQKLQNWIEHGELFVEVRDEAAFFWRKDRDFWRLYFAAASLAGLQQAVAGLPELGTEPVVMDLVGNEVVLGDQLALWKTAGFRHYTRLRRMVRSGQSVPPPSGGDGPQPIYADKADAPAILDLLGESFDRYAEQLPALYEIEPAAESRQILVMKDREMLGGLLFFETRGLASTIRYWLVAKPFRTSRFGSALMRHYLAAQGAVRRFTLWVNAENENAIQKYRHYGYAPDELVDCILVNQIIHP